MRVRPLFPPTWASWQRYDDAVGRSPTNGPEPQHKTGEGLWRRSLQEVSVGGLGRRSLQKVSAEGLLLTR